MGKNAGAGEAASAPESRPEPGPKHAPELKKDLRQMRRLLTGVAGAAALAVGMVVSILIGSVEVSVGDIAAALSGDSSGGNYHIIWNIRLPRILIGVLVGVNLALAGVILQGVLRNPLADPGIIGVTSGAGLAAMAVMILLPGRSGLVPLCAFAGAITATLFVYLLSWKRGIHPLRLILAGVATAAFFGAMISTLMVFHSDKVQGTINWMVGGFQGRSWDHVSMVAPYTVAGALITLMGYRHLNILLLGDEVAKGLGVRVEAVRLGFLCLASFLAASAVSVAGLLGFVGLIVPHAVRLVVGSDHRFLLPSSALFGAALIVFADTAARTVFRPVEIPVGVLMAFLGAPFFLYLLRGAMKR